MNKLFWVYALVVTVLLAVVISGGLSQRNTIERLEQIRGTSYRHRMQRVLDIYNAHVNEGLSTREILRRYIQPEFPISESTLYNYFGKEFSDEANRTEEPGLFDGLEENGL